LASDMVGSPFDPDCLKRMRNFDALMSSSK